MFTVAYHTLVGLWLSCKSNESHPGVAYHTLVYFTTYFTTVAYHTLAGLWLSCKSKESQPGGWAFQKNGKQRPQFARITLLKKRYKV